MDSLLLAFNTIFPMLILMLTGFVARHKNWFGEQTAIDSNRVVYSIFLPAVCFYGIYKMDYDSPINTDFLIWTAVSLTLIFIVATIIVHFTVRREYRASLAQAVFRSNYVLFGIPLAQSLLSPQLLGQVMLPSVVAMPLYNIFAIFLFEYYGEQKFNYKKLFKGIVFNPIIVSTLLGLAAWLLRIRFPYAIDKSISYLAQMASPLALFALGAQFEFKAASACWRELVWAVTSRLLIVPAIFLPITAALGFRGPEMVAAMVVFAGPVAVSSYSIAQEMGGDTVLPGQTLVYTSSFSIVTMFLLIWLMKSLGYI
ncbi:MAG: AEC family transporter [Clostridiaceae bacterium]|nr:AEC family transporter [Clostridiaceae bacterium]